MYAEFTLTGTRFGLVLWSFVPSRSMLDPRLVAWILAIRRARLLKRGSLCALTTVLPSQSESETERECVFPDPAKGKGRHFCTHFLVRIISLNSEKKYEQNKPGLRLTFKSLHLLLCFCVFVYARVRRQARIMCHMREGLEGLKRGEICS